MVVGYTEPKHFSCLYSSFFYLVLPLEWHYQHYKLTSLRFYGCYYIYTIRMSAFLGFHVIRRESSTFFTLPHFLSVSDSLFLLVLYLSVKMRLNSTMPCILCIWLTNTVLFTFSVITCDMNDSNKLPSHIFYAFRWWDNLNAHKSYGQYFMYSNIDRTIGWIHSFFLCANIHIKMNVKALNSTWIMAIEIKAFKEELLSGIAYTWHINRFDTPPNRILAAL